MLPSLLLTEKTNICQRLQLLNHKRVEKRKIRLITKTSSDTLGCIILKGLILSSVSKDLQNQAGFEETHANMQDNLTFIKLVRETIIGKSLIKIKICGCFTAKKHIFLSTSLFHFSSNNNKSLTTDAAKLAEYFKTARQKF